MLSGPHAGAEVRLVAGPYRIGRDEDADIVLEDQAMASEHALVVIEAGGTCVEPLLGEVLIDHVPHKDGHKRVPFFTVLGFGATHLAFGPEGAAWPALAPPAPRSPPAGPEAADAAAGAAPLAAPDGAGAAGAGVVPVPVAAAAVATSGRRGGRSSVTTLAVMIGLGLVLLARPLEHMGEAPAAVIPPPPPPVPGSAEALAASEPAVRVALADVEVSGLKLEPDTRRGRLIVEGWVEDEAERKAVAERLAELDEPLSVRLWSREAVLDGVGTTLQALGRPIESDWVGPGEVSLRGYIPDASDLQRAVDLLQRDVAGLRAVRNEVMTDEAIEAWLARRLAEAGLAEAVRLKRGDRGLQARGVLTAEQRAAFGKVAAAYAEGPGRYLGLVEQFVDAKGSSPNVPLPPEVARLGVRAVNPGPPAYVVLDDGQKYLAGSRLPGGWTLERIDKSAVVVSRDGRREQVAF